MTPEEARVLVDGLGDAFAAGDGAAVLAAFARGDAILYAGSEPGECAVGRRVLARLLADLFGRDERYLWRCAPGRDAVRVAPGLRDVAVVAEATLFVLPRTGSPAVAEAFPYRVSGVLVREPGGWRWRFCQGAEPAATP